MTFPEQLLTCPKCMAVLPSAMADIDEPRPCPACHTYLQVTLFPAFFRAEQAAAAEPVVAPGDASCFYHAEKKASIVCDLCGRFLCSLCDIEFDGQHLCPACLESGRQKGKIKKLENQRIRYDNRALVWALLPMVVVYPTLITGPIALFYAIRHWNSPRTIVPAWPRVRLAVAILLALAQIIGWTVFFILRPWRH